MNYTELPDIEIWARFKGGDIDAFSFIYGVEKIKVLEHSNVIKFSEKNQNLTVRAQIDSVNLVKEAYKISVINDLAEFLA